MDKREAKEILDGQMSIFRDKSYAELVRYLDHPESFEVAGKSGKKYQLEAAALWDDPKAKHLMLMLSVDDGGISAWSPMSQSFIVAPDGRFIGK